MSLPTRDPKKRSRQLREWRERGTKAYEARLREEHDYPVRGIGTNPERRKKQWRRAYGSTDRVLWVNRQPSVASGQTPCVNAHVPDPSGPSGTGRKADARWVVPLTWDEHEELHAIGVESFEAKWGIDLQEQARRTEAAWIEHQRGED